MLLWLTLLDSVAMLLVLGLAAVVAWVRRRATNWVTGLSLLASMLGFAAGIVAATNGLGGLRDWTSVTPASIS